MAAAFYKPEDVALLKYIQQLLYKEGYTIRGVQAALKQAKPKELKTLVQQLTPKLSSPNWQPSKTC